MGSLDGWRAVRRMLLLAAVAAGVGCSPDEPEIHVTKAPLSDFSSCALVGEGDVLRFDCDWDVDHCFTLDDDVQLTVNGAPAEFTWRGGQVREEDVGADLPPFTRLQCATPTLSAPTNPPGGPLTIEIKDATTSWHLDAPAQPDVELVSPLPSTLRRGDSTVDVRSELAASQIQPELLDANGSLLSNNFQRVDPVVHADGTITYFLGWDECTRTKETIEATFRMELSRPVTCQGPASCSLWAYTPDLPVSLVYEPCD